ncbi:hypothetical protein AAC03nite_39320 [Alicyclobacillus acidoterrestris]|nr:hypothetical protein AAC03nite_39320 [Alicyclobacillus acidoterrestris]
MGISSLGKGTGLTAVAIAIGTVGITGLYHSKAWAQTNNVSCSAAKGSSATCSNTLTASNGNGVWKDTMTDVYDPGSSNVEVVETTLAPTVSSGDAYYEDYWVQSNVTGDYQEYYDLDGIHLNSIGSDTFEVDWTGAVNSSFPYINTVMYIEGGASPASCQGLSASCPEYQQQNWLYNKAYGSPSNGALIPASSSTMTALNTTSTANTTSTNSQLTSMTPSQAKSDAPFSFKMPTAFNSTVDSNQAYLRTIGNNTPGVHMDFSLQNGDVVQFNTTDHNVELASKKYNVSNITLPNGIFAQYMDNGHGKTVSWNENGVNYTLTLMGNEDGNFSSQNVSQLDLESIAESIK